MAHSDGHCFQWVFKRRNYMWPRKKSVTSEMEKELHEYGIYFILWLTHVLSVIMAFFFAFFWSDLAFWIFPSCFPRGFDSLFLRAAMLLLHMLLHNCKTCNPSDAAGNATTIVTNNEYFMKLYQAHYKKHVSLSICLPLQIVQIPFSCLSTCKTNTMWTDNKASQSVFGEMAAIISNICLCECKFTKRGR